MPEPVIETTAAAEASATPAAVVTPAAGTPAAGSAAPVTPVAPAAPVLPETYTLTLPDGSPLAPTVLEQVTPIAKALKAASDADAQAIVGLLDSASREVIQTYEAARAPGGALHAELVKQVAADALAHPDLGNGDPAKFERAQLHAGLVLNQYGQTGLAEAVKARGYLTVPEMLFLNAVHAATSEAPLVTGAAVRAAANQPWERAMYPEGIKLGAGEPAAP